MKGKQDTLGSQVEEKETIICIFTEWNEQKLEYKDFMIKKNTTQTSHQAVFANPLTMSQPDYVYYGNLRSALKVLLPYRGRYLCW